VLKGESIAALWLAAAPALLPDRAGLMVVYAFLGCVGGLGAAANDKQPSLKLGILKAITGLAIGTCLGAAGTAWLGSDDRGFWWTAAGSVAGGFLGPITIWDIGVKYFPRFPERPSDPPAKP
jgi:hypothetical protein